MQINLSGDFQLIYLFNIPTFTRLYYLLVGNSCTFSTIAHRTVEVCRISKGFQLICHVFWIPKRNKFFDFYNWIKYIPTSDDYNCELVLFSMLLSRIFPLHHFLAFEHTENHFKQLVWTLTRKRATIVRRRKWLKIAAKIIVSNKCLDEISNSHMQP